MTIARLFVDPPRLEPRSSGLLAVAELATASGERWRNGVEVQPFCGDRAASIVATCQPSETGTVKSPTGGDGRVVGADPFAVYSWLPVPVRCSDARFEELKARTASALTSGEARTVERVFWTGDVGDGAQRYPHLAADAEVVDGDVVLQTAAEIVTGAPVDPVTAVGLLEQAIAACYPGRAVIHASAGAIPVLAECRQLVSDGPGRWTTPAGTLVAAGAGYPGTGPDGSTPPVGGTWFYATGAVKVWRSDIEWTSTPAEAIDKALNTTVLIAERTYVIAWDCCHFAVPVQLACPS